jgi:Aerobic-type carbon monoxide dehydrogenase, middle subunit CoxM/CutM homologs
VKPAKFEYHVPSTLDQALEVLGSLAEDGDAKILAGGQSLIPLMNMRLSRPEHLIDLRNILELQRLSVDETSVVAGSMVTQREVEQSAAVAAGNPLLTSAIGNIAHFQIRERGTIGGSIAHADPSAELPLLAVLLEIGRASCRERV